MHQSFAGASPEVRKEARTQLAGILGMQALMGGATGFFGWNVVMGVAGLFGLFGSDDDPRDPEARLRGAVVDLFGTEIGGMILKGVPGHLTGIDLSSRVGMMDFFLRMPDSGKEGRDYATELLVALTGASGSTFVSMFDGFHLLSTGKVGQGVGAMGPKFIRDALAAARYAGEGLRTRSGEVILEREDMDWWDVARKAIGFQPARVAEAYERNAVLYDAADRVQTERRALMRRFTDAIMADDAAARAAAVDAIVEWNRKGYARTMPITEDALRQSLAARLRNQAKREDGVLIQSEALGQYLRMLMPQRVYR